MPAQIRINNVALVTHHLHQQNLHKQDQQTLWIAVIFSLLIHLSFYYILPYIKSQPTLPNLRIEVSMSGAMQTQPSKPAPTTPPTPVSETPPTVEPVKTPTKTPVKTTPVLATEAPSATDDYVVPNKPAPEATSAPAPTTAASNPNTASNTAESSTQTNSNQSNSTTQTTNAEEATTEEAWDGYGQALYDAVSKYKNYPQIAVRRNWEGQAKARAKFVLGKLVDIELIDSSGHQVLDNEAIAMIREAIMQMPVKGGLARKSFTVTVPVSFRLDR